MALLSGLVPACDAALPDLDPTVDRAQERGDDGDRCDARRRSASWAGLVDAAVVSTIASDAQSDELSRSFEQLAAARADQQRRQRDLREMLAGAIASDSLDTAAFRDPVDDLEAAALAEAEAIEATLDDVHAVLSTPQRQRLVASPPTRASRHGPPPDGPAMRSLARTLRLTDEQLVALHDTLGPPEPPPSSVADARLRAEFLGDAFVAAAYRLTEVHPMAVRDRFERELERARALVPMLTDEQRDRFVTAVRDH